MEYDFNPTFVIYELIDAAKSKELSHVVIEFDDRDSTWGIAVHLRNGWIYKLAEQEGFAVMYFKNLRDALILLNGAGVKQVRLELNKWSPTEGAL